MAVNRCKQYMTNEIIPFVDLKTSYIANRKAFDKAISSVCLSSAYILGPEVQRFEERFADYIGVSEAIGVANGTDALRLTCQALGIGKDDEVLIPANTFIATALAVHDLGGRVVPVDIDPHTYLIDLTDAQNKISERTKAMIVVHLYGQCADMDQVLSFIEQNRLLLIEDACQSHGAAWKGKRTGGIGIAGCFSFYPAKNLGAFGDGGMITTHQVLLAKKLRLLRNYGSVEKYIHEYPGTNSRLDSLQAAVLNVKLDSLDDCNVRRFEAACRYAEGLNNVNEIVLPTFDRNNPLGHVFHLFVIQCDSRSDLMNYLNSEGIQYGIHYPRPIHLHQAFESLGIGPGSLPVSESLANKILSLPMFPEITSEQTSRVVKAIKAFYGK